MKIKILLSLLFLSSCGYEAMKPGSEIVEIRMYYTDGLCVYYTSAKNATAIEVCAKGGGWFVDSCGRFNIGDRVWLTRR